MEPHPYAPQAKARRGGGGGWAWALLLLMLAGGAGYLAWHYRSKAQDAAVRLTETAAAETRCSRQLGVKEADLLACTRERDAARQLGEGAQQKLSTVSATLNASQAELEALRKQRAEAESRLAAVKELTDKFKRMIDTGKLAVSIRRGRMIVKLPASVLFASGSAELSPDGQAALEEVARILRQDRKRRFIVAGHTDDVPVSASRYKSNWELSTARAVTVTEFLIKKRMRAQNLSAAGYAEHDPVASNRTEEGRQQNRRIEIILLPYIEEIPELPEITKAKSH